eukprot:CAMPEP_0198151608 /NCGR_PEP_ID=MMETSP1443-20131203/56265_1 /TAXON_ID=186043 /ORGANISM="Entomoneis sp., Strain CCMP2396" /LENGTH=244 /DNA_ID=CAMNT_0043817335 /DNA_START=36 /DNA_END=770 /DNA_ORIENTATION=-
MTMKSCKASCSQHWSLLLLFHQRPVFLMVFLVVLLVVPIVDAFDIQFRSATPQDINLARRLILQAKMNPLSITAKHLLVAYNYDAVGDNSCDNDNYIKNHQLLGFGQIRPLSLEYSELASLYVIPNARHQGVATALTQELLQRHYCQQQKQHENPAAAAATPSTICLLTLKPTMPLYQKFGFRQVFFPNDADAVAEGDDNGNDVQFNSSSMLPQAIQMEYKAGQFLSKFLGNELVCMELKKEYS